MGPSILVSYGRCIRPDWTIRNIFNQPEFQLDSHYIAEKLSRVVTIGKLYRDSTAHSINGQTRNKYYLLRSVKYIGSEGPKPVLDRLSTLQLVRVVALWLTTSFLSVGAVSGSLNSELPWKRTRDSWDFSKGVGRHQASPIQKWSERLET